MNKEGNFHQLISIEHNGHRFIGSFVRSYSGFVCVLYDYRKSYSVISTTKETKQRFFFMKEEGYELQLNSLNFIENGNVYLIKQYKAKFDNFNQIHENDFINFMQNNKIKGKQENNKKF